jgi:hypothetical protein
MKVVLPALICIAVLSTSCDRSTSLPPPDLYLGTWESHSFKMHISNSGEKYLIELDNHRGMLSGEYVGELIDGGITVTVPLAGEQQIRISRNGVSLVFIGEQLEKVVQ